MSGFAKSGATWMIRIHPARLDFEAFQSLVTRAIFAVGADHPGLEMFCHYARGEGWFAWMVQELQNAPSRRVA